MFNILFLLRYKVSIKNISYGIYNKEEVEIQIKRSK